MRSGKWVQFVLAICLAAAASWAADLRVLDAVKRRDAKAFDILMAQKADIDAKAPDGATALSWAVFLDLQDMAEKLIAAGAKVNTANDYGETPLTLALANGNAGLAEKLLKAGADPEGRPLGRRDRSHDRRRRRQRGRSADAARSRLGRECAPSRIECRTR